MVPLGRFAQVGHLAVGATVAGVGLLTATGVLGSSHPELFDAKQVVIAPAGGEALRVVETVDMDFGRNARHGYQRIIPNDFGTPTEVTASAVGAPDDLDVSAMYFDTRIRIGDPDVTVRGRHRYELAYTYPEARLTSGRLGLDVIGTEETLRTERFEVIVTGLELDNPVCSVGDLDDTGGCELVDDGETYRAVFEPLEPGQGVTIGGDIVGERPIVDIAAPALPPTKGGTPVPLTLATVAAGGLSGAGVFLAFRRRGRNEVFVGGAADAAFGFTPPAAPGTTDLEPPDGWERVPPAAAADAELDPPTGAPSPPPVGSVEVPAPTGTAVRLVADDRLGDLATTEFVPPPGVDPWLGRLLLKEEYDQHLVATWLSGLAGRGVIKVGTNDRRRVRLSIGPEFERASGEDRSSLHRMFGKDGAITLGSYSKAFSSEWRAVATRQRKFVATSGLWKHRLPTSATTVVGMLIAATVIAVMVSFLFARNSVATLGVFSTVPGAIVVAVVVPAVIAAAVYYRLLAARTATGSALALRTESFRRFLAASESRHVEWAWKHGLLREYSAWAVALGTAQTWEAAATRSAVPPAETSNMPAMLLYHNSSQLRTSQTKPSSSGGGGRGGFGGGGGGFSGGSVGGGGGGGSSGSW